MRLFRPAFPAGCLYPEAIFRIKAEKVLYLSFDDGPDPDSTPLLLSMLRKYKVPAVFFCTGEAAEKYPDLVNQILNEGHRIGNHTYSHINGWKASAKKYLEDIEKASPLTSNRIFRPPYGKLRIRQYLILKEKFRIVFWDVMAYDFDPLFGNDRSLNILKTRIRSGSVIVLHDSRKSTANLLMEEFLIFALEKGYRFSNEIH